MSPLGKRNYRVQTSREPAHRDSVIPSTQYLMTMSSLRSIRSRTVLAARGLADAAPPRLSLVLVDAIERRAGEPELKFLTALVRPGAIAGDVGANRGVYARRLARLCPLVVAFEPQPRLAGRLARATADNVLVLTVALSGTAGEATLKVPVIDSVSAHTRATLGEAGDEYTEVTVLRMRLDDLRLESLGFLKIDVEGHEMDLLDGGMETIERCRPRLLVECDVQMGTHPCDVAQRLAPLGYEGWFYYRGAVLPVDEFDVDVHQSERKVFGGPRPAAQASNFIFLPSTEATEVTEALRDLARAVG